jgi:hypothetical protein
MQEFITESISSTYSITTVAPELDGPKVSKKDPYRPCIDYRPLNKQMIKRAYPVPNINQIISCLSGRFWFSSFDALKGYWQR